VAEVEHKGVQEVGSKDEVSEVVVGPRGFAGEFAPSLMGEDEGLGDGHFVLGLLSGLLQGGVFAIGNVRHARITTGGRGFIGDGW